MNSEKINYDYILLKIDGWGVGTHIYYRLMHLYRDNDENTHI